MLHHHRKHHHKTKVSKNKMVKLRVQIADNFESGHRVAVPRGGFQREIEKVSGEVFDVLMLFL